MGVKQLKQKFNPWLISRGIERINSFQKTALPAWHSAMKRFPPAQRPSSFVISPHANQFQDVHQLHATYSRQVKSSQSFVRSQKHIGPLNTTKPPSIVYSEDIIRDTFYNQHKWELVRPIQLTANQQNINWTSIHGSPAQKLSGEWYYQSYRPF